MFKSMLLCLKLKIQTSLAISNVVYYATMNTASDHVRLSVILAYMCNRLRV